VAAAVVRTAELDEQETRERLTRPAAKAAAEDSQKSEELEMQWHKEEAARAAKDASALEFTAAALKKQVLLSFTSWNSTT